MDSNKTVVLPRPGRRKKQNDLPPVEKNIGPQRESHPTLKSRIQRHADGKKNSTRSPNPTGSNHQVNLLAVSDNEEIKLSAFDDLILPVLVQYGKIKGSIDCQEPGVLFQRSVESILQVSNHASETLGLNEKEANWTSYILCSLLDEAVLNTPWAPESPWGKETLLVRFHGDSHGGERFFELVEELLTNRLHSSYLIRLCYYALSAGFTGKLALQSDGQLEQTRFLEHLFDRVKLQGKPPSNLSGQLEVIKNWNEPSSRMAPVHLCISIGALILLGLFVFLSWRLSTWTKPIETAATQLYQLNLEASKHDELVLERLKNVLEVESAEGKLNLAANGDGVIIRIGADILFENQQNTLSEQAKKLLDRVGHALKRLPGYIVVSGHTDDRQISTLAFPSNWHLSNHRSQLVAEHLASFLDLRDRITSQARGSSDPIRRGITPEDRQKNRRVDITLSHSYIADDLEEKK